MLKAFEAIALHWERETGGGQERMREGARWLRTAIDKVRRGETYDGCGHQGPNPWAENDQLREVLALALNETSIPGAFPGWAARASDALGKYPCDSCQT
jgi:hypothetical protein